MEIHEMMAPERVIMHLQGSTKEEILIELAEKEATSGKVKDVDALKRAILDREDIMSTGIGVTLAFPHAKIPEVSDFVLAIGRKPEGIDYDSLDGMPVKIVTMIAAPEGQQNTYLRVLAKVTQVLRDDATRNKVLAAETPEEIIDLFKD